MIDAFDNAPHALRAGAYELYQLLRGGRARDAVSRYPEISRERLSRTGVTRG